MLVTLLIWLYTFTLAYLYGWLLLTIMCRLLRLDNRPLSFPLVVMAGLVFITTIVSFLSLFIKIGLLAELILLAGAVGIMVRGKPYSSLRICIRSPLCWGLFALACLTVLENAVLPPSNPDTKIYHAQTIRWIETFRAVPGLGNLYVPLAQNSSWFLINAAFSFSFLGRHSFHLTSSVMVLATLLYFIEGLEGLLRKERTLSRWIKVFSFPLVFYLLRSEFSSPSTDLPVILLAWVLLTLWLERVETRFARPDVAMALIFVLSLYAVTVKLSAVILMGFALYIFFESLLLREGRVVLGFAMVGTILLFPWLVRNVILSGYLVFPFAGIDIFTFEWKIPLSTIEGLSSRVTGWGRLPGKNWFRAVDRPLSVWLPVWFAQKSFNQKAVFLAAMFTPLALPLLWSVRRKDFWYYALAWLINYISILFWFIKSPNFRYAYGPIVGVLLLIFVPLLAWFAERLDTRQAWLPIAVAAVLFCNQAFELSGSFNASTLSRQLLMPASYSPSVVEACKLHNATIFCSTKWHNCGYQAFPCIHSPRLGVELRGPTYQDGFRIVE